MASTPRDQPTNVATEDAPRPPDNSVVTSDTPKEAAESREADAGAKAAAASDGGTNESNSAADEPSKQTPKRNPPAERRIKKLSAKLSAEKAQTQAQASRIHDLETENQALKDATPAPVEPKLEDFDTPQKYAKAYAQWEKPPAARKPPPGKPPANPPALDPTVEAFHKAGRKLLGDEFDEALEEEGTAISQVMAEYLFDNELGGAIYVHLANNQDESRKIFDMTAPKAAKAMEKLEAKAKEGKLDIEGTLQIAAAPELGEHDTGDAKPPAKPPAKKPKFTPPSGQDAGDANLNPDPENEGMDAYAERRNKEIMRSRGIPV